MYMNSQMCISCWLSLLHRVGVKLISVLFEGWFLINCVRKAFEFGMEGILIERGAARATSKKGKRERKIPLQILRVAVSLLPFPLKLTFEELVSTGGERRVYAVGIPPPFKLFFFRRTDVSHVRAWRISIFHSGDIRSTFLVVCSAKSS